MEVTDCFSLTSKTYFDAIYLMDRYMLLETRALVPGQLHVVGVTALVLASKMNEIHPLSIKTAYEKLAHRKIPMSGLLDREKRFMDVLGWNLGSATAFDVAMTRLSQALPDNNNCKGKIAKLCELLCKAAAIDYETYSKQTPLLLGEAVFKAALEATRMTT